MSATDARWVLLVRVCGWGAILSNMLVWESDRLPVPSVAGIAFAVVAVALATATLTLVLLNGGPGSRRLDMPAWERWFLTIYAVIVLLIWTSLAVMCLRIRSILEGHFPPDGIC